LIYKGDMQTILLSKVIHEEKSSLEGQGTISREVHTGADKQFEGFLGN
jgi:hypothetical protein